MRTKCEQRVRKGGGGEDVDGKQSGVEGEAERLSCFSPCDMDVLGKLVKCTLEGTRTGHDTKMQKMHFKGDWKRKSRNENDQK